jgi:hypothetical protein
MNEHELKISDDIKLKILKTYIEPSYTDDVDNLIKGKKCWRISGQIFETISKIFVAVGGIISFSSGYFSYPVLGFVAGGISTVSLALLQFSSFSYSENKKQSQELNLILKKINVETLPVLERNNDTTSLRQTSTPTLDINPETKRYIDREEQLKQLLLRQENHIRDLGISFQDKEIEFKRNQDQQQAEIRKLVELLNQKNEKQSTFTISEDSQETDL